MAWKSRWTVPLIVEPHAEYTDLGPGVSAQPGFYYRGVYQPLLLSWVGGTARCQYLDMTDRLEPPPLQVTQIYKQQSDF
jgi:hypothetical protein